MGWGESGGERALKRAILRTHSELKKTHIAFIQAESNGSVLLSKRKQMVHLVPVGKVFIPSWVMFLNKTLLSTALKEGNRIS